MGFQKILPSKHSRDGSGSSIGILRSNTTIPHDQLKSKLKKNINPCFFHKNGNRRS